MPARKEPTARAVYMEKIECMFIDRRPILFTLISSSTPVSKVVKRTASTSSLAASSFRNVLATAKTAAAEEECF